VFGATSVPLAPSPLVTERPEGTVRTFEPVVAISVLNVRVMCVSFADAAFDRVRVAPPGATDTTVVLGGIPVPLTSSPASVAA
jgi:hypothetical protein